MDFLDSLDLETTNKRAHRVRSWYLYEQFKSLERNQLEAAQKLKDRSYQDKILRQELSERRARRKIYDQFGLCQSETRLERSIKNSGNKTELSVSADDFFESVCELQEEEELDQEKVLSEDTFSQDDSIEGKYYTEEFKTVEDTKDHSYEESVSSVVENINHDGNLSDDIKKVLKAETNIAQNIHLQLEEVKENIQCIEMYTELADDMISEDTNSIGKLKTKHVMTGNKAVKDYENNLIKIWTRLVSFAYQAMQLNHGNCYYDYSSQFMTAVLACDVLRRGVSRMCNILQPYVSPIKYATDESDTSVDSLIHLNRKKAVASKKSGKSFRHTIHTHRRSKQISAIRNGRKYRSEECWQRGTRDSFYCHSNKKCRRASEPWHSISKLHTIKREVSEKSSSSTSIWPDFSKEDVRSNRLKVCECSWHREVETPMLKIARYIDSILKELEEYNHK